MKIKAILGAFNSKRDMYGNCYWAFRWTWTDAAEGVDAYGTISGGLSNLTSIAYALKLDPREVQVIEKEIPIREFNRLVKGWPYAGCTAEELGRFITARTPAPAKDPAPDKLRQAVIALFDALEEAQSTSDTLDALDGALPALREALGPVQAQDKLSNAAPDLLESLRDVLVWQATFERGECRRGDFQTSIDDAQNLIDKLTT